MVVVKMFLVFLVADKMFVMVLQPDQRRKEHQYNQPEGSVIVQLCPHGQFVLLYR